MTKQNKKNLRTKYIFNKRSYQKQTKKYKDKCVKYFHFAKNKIVNSVKKVKTKYISIKRSCQEKVKKYKEICRENVGHVKNKIKSFIEKVKIYFSFYRYTHKNLPVIIFSLIIIAIYWIGQLPIIEEIDIESLLIWAGYIYPSDKLVSSFIDGIVKFIAFSIPLTFTFYYFVCREQKAIAESSLNAKNTPLTHFLLISVLTFIIGFYLNTLIGNANSDDLKYTSQNITRLFIFVILLLVLVGAGYKAACYLLESINIRFLLQRVLRNLKNELVILLNLNTLKKQDRFSKKIYNNLFYSVESVYQMLIQTVAKDMTEVFDSNYTSWKEVLKTIQNENENERRNILLLSNDPQNYSALYKSILKNHLSLIIGLYNKNKIQEGYQAVCDLFSLSPEADIDSTDNELLNNYNHLMLDYLAILSELSLFLYKNGIGIHPIIQNIRKMPLYRIGIDNIICVYRMLIIKAVEQNDVKLLVTLTYALTSPVEILCRSSQKSKITDFKSRMEMVVCKTIAANDEKKDEEDDDDELHDLGTCLYVLLNAALKSVELSHYSCVGFIIKYVASNFPSDITNNVYCKLVANRGIDLKFDDFDLGKQLGLDSFNINDKTATYCLEKLSILFYGQQKYLSEKQVMICHIPETFLEISKLISQNHEYIFTKLEKGKSKYGLVWMEETFMGNLGKDLTVLFESDKRSELL